MVAHRAAASYADDVAFVTWTSGTTGRAETGPAHAHELSRAARPGPRSAARRVPPPSGRAPAGPSPNLVPGLAGAERRHLQRVVRAARGRGDRRHGRLRPARLRRARRAGSRSARPCCRPRRWRCSPTPPDVVDLAPLRYVRSITAPLSPLQARRFSEKFGVVVLNGYGQAEIGEVIGWTAADARGASGEARRGRSAASRRVDQDRAGRRTEHASRRRRRAAARAAAVDRGRDRDRAGRRRRFRRHRRPRPHRRRRFRVDRGPGRRRHQPRRQQGLPRARRGGAAAGPERGRRRGRRACPTSGSARCPSRTSSRSGAVADDDARRRLPRAPRARTRSRWRSTASTRCRAARSARCCAGSSCRPDLGSTRAASNESDSGRVSACRFPAEPTPREIARRPCGRVVQLRRRVARCARAPTPGCRAPNAIAVSQPLMTASTAARPGTVPSTSTVRSSSATGLARVSPITSVTSEPSGSRIA